MVAAATRAPSLSPSLNNDLPSGRGDALIRGVKVRPAQEEGNGSGAVGKHKHGCPEKAGASCAEDGGGVDGTAKLDGACKGRSAQMSQGQGAASMSQMAVST